MAHVLADRVRETSTTTGTGAFALLGAAPGFRAFSAVAATGDTVPYCAVMGAEWEVGVGTLTGPATLARTTVTSSSNGGAAVNFGAGLKDVQITGSADNSFMRRGGALSLAGDASGTVTMANGAMSLALALAPSGVAAGTYAGATVVVDAKGRVTSAAAVSYQPADAGLSSLAGLAGAGVVRATAADAYALNAVGAAAATDLLDRAAGDGRYLQLAAANSASGTLALTNATASTSPSTGALRLSGGLGVALALHAGGKISAAGQLESTVPTGTAPLAVASTTRVVNLNADFLDDQAGAYYLDLANATGNLAVARLNSGTGAGAATFWRGDGTWATPATGNVAVSDEGTALTAAASGLNFVGGGVTATASGGAVTVTVPGESDTLATVTARGAATAANLTLSGGTTSLANATSNIVIWNNNGVAPPAFNTRSAGAKLVLNGAVNASQADYALGIEGSALWLGVPTSAQSFKFYGGTATAATISGSGNASFGGTVACAAPAAAGHAATKAYADALPAQKVVPVAAQWPNTLFDPGGSETSFFDTAIPAGTRWVAGTAHGGCIADPAGTGTVTMRVRLMNAGAVSQAVADIPMRALNGGYAHASGRFLFDAGAAQTGWFLRFSAFRDGAGTNRVSEYTTLFTAIAP